MIGTAERSFVILVPGEQSVRVLQLLKNKTNSLTAHIDWGGRSRIEFTSNDSEKLLVKIRLASPGSLIEERKSGATETIPEVPVGTWIEGRVVACPNKNCVTVQPKEPTKPKFRIVSWNPVTLQCYYCGRYIDQDTIGQQLG